MLADDDCSMIPDQIRDVFISHSQEETQEMLEDAKVCGNLASGKDFQVGKFIITENA